MDEPSLKARDIEALTYVFTPTEKATSPGRDSRRRRPFHLGVTLIAVGAGLVLAVTLAWLVRPV